MRRNKILFLCLPLAAAAAVAFEIPKGAHEPVIALPDGSKVGVELALTREE